MRGAQRIHLGRERNHFKVWVAFSLRMAKESVSSRLCFRLKEIQIFVASNLKSDFLVEGEGSHLFSKETFIMAFKAMLRSLQN